LIHLQEASWRKGKEASAEADTLPYRKEKERIQYRYKSSKGRYI
jgi:hypothetical protein